MQLFSCTSGCPWPSDTVKSPGSPSMSWKSCAKKIPGPGSCEAPCVKSRSQNWDPTSWKSRPKSFQVSVLETASVKIQASKLRSQVLKTMSWKPYPKISQAPKLRSQVLKTISWKPYPKISQVFLGLGNPECKLQVSKNLLPQKIRLPLISFLSGVSYIWGSYIWGSSTGNGQWLEESSRHCPHRQTDTVALISLVYMKCQH